MLKWNSPKTSLIICLIALSLNVTAALAFSVDEATDGDLSGIEQVPTVLELSLGDNIIAGSAGSVGLNQDYDIFTFRVSSNMVLSSITVNAYEPSNGVSFLGVQAAASQWTAGKGNGITGSDLSGWTLFGANDIGTDVLPTMSTALSGASGFDLPLGPDDYVFLIQDTGSAINYELNFTASPVPLPASLPLLGLAALGLLRRRRAAVGRVTAD